MAQVSKEMRIIDIINVDYDIVPIYLMRECTASAVRQHRANLWRRLLLFTVLTRMRLQLRLMSFLQRSNQTGCWEILLKFKSESYVAF